MNTAFISLIPSIIILVLIYRFDIKKEPIKMLLVAFVGGFFAAFIWTNISQLIGFSSIDQVNLETHDEVSNRLTHILYNIVKFIGMSAPIELAKWLAFIILIRSSKYFDQYYDGIIYAFCINIGFNSFDIYSGVLNGRQIESPIFYGIFFAPTYSLVAVIMGYFLSLSRFEKNETYLINLLKSLIYPIILNGLFYFLMFAKFIDPDKPLENWWITLVYLIFTISLWRFSINKLKEYANYDKEID